MRYCGVVVITSALHAEGPQFDPGQYHLFFFTISTVTIDFKTEVKNIRPDRDLNPGP